MIIIIIILIIIIIIIIIIISRCYVKVNSFVQFLCPKFALTSSRYSYGINPIVGIRLNVEYMLVTIIIVIIMMLMIIMLIEIIVNKYIIPERH